MTIYAWPPVGLKSHPVWTVRDPIQTSTSLFTGRRYASRHSRRRIYAEYSVGALRNDGRGYMESLKRFLEGGVNYVRLSRLPVEPLPKGDDLVVWTSGGDELVWTVGGEPLRWATGRRSAMLVTENGVPAILLRGFDPGIQICRPGEFVQIEDEIRMCVAPASSRADGSVTIRVDSQFPAGGLAEIGVAETAIFRAVQMPEVGGGLDEDATYDWSFEQVYLDEIGEQTEVNPW